MNKRIRRALLPLAISALFAVTPVMAQTDTSSAITGVVTNAEGQPVPGATVVIVHEPSGTTATVTTDANGRYNASGLRVGGPYEVTVSKGDREREREGLYLSLGETSAVSVMLTPPQELGTITVTANALTRVFSPEHMGISTNISERQLNLMPTPGRSIQNVVRMDPRVVIGDRGDGKIMAIGQNFRYNNITVDSVSANDPFGLNANGLPTKGTAISQDTIAAYNISTADYDVTTRRGLGVNVNAVTKSGTNEFHGSLYYVYQNDDMIGKNQDEKPFTAFEKDWTGGFTLGGPIVKDKLFFFASYEQSEIVGGSSVWGPEGSGSSQIVDGITDEDVQKVRDIAADYGFSNLGGLTGTGQQLQDKRYLVKLDWNINQNHRASLTWRRTKEHEPRVGGSQDAVDLSSAWITTDTDNESYALHLYDDWSLNFSSTATVSYSHFNRVGGPYNGVPMPAVTVHKGDRFGPTINFGTNYAYQANKIDTETWYVDWAGTWYLGDHAIKFGFDYEKNEKYNLYLRNYFGSYEFSSIEDFASANINRYRYARPADGLQLGDVAAAYGLQQWGLFVQDTWRVNNQLTLQYGVRVDIPKTDDEPLYNPVFAEAGFTTETGTVLTTNQYTVDGEQIIQPRASFNYQFNTDLMMQLRGGVGLFVSNPPAVWIGNIYSNTGVNAVAFDCKGWLGCNPEFSADPYGQVDPPTGGGGQMTVNTLDPDFQLPSSWKYTLGFDMELPWMGLIGTIDWQHIEVKDAIWYQNLNLGEPTGVLPDGRYTYYEDPYADDYRNDARANANGAFSGEIIHLANTDKGEADSVTLQLKRPFRNNWSAMVAVTWGNAKDVNPGLSSVAYSSWKQVQITNANENVVSTSNYETTWRTIASVAWRHAFFGDYYTSFSAFYDGHSGHPYSWVFRDDVNGDGAYNDLVYIPKKGDVLFAPGTDPQRIAEFWSFIENNDYLSSNQGQIAERNGTRAPWFNQLDLSISQEIPGLFDGNKGVIQLDIYNFLNLLDEDWGVETRAGWPDVRALAKYAGVDEATGKYIYDISGYPFEHDGHYGPETIEPYSYYTTGDRAQRWAVRLTVRYEF